MYWIRYLQLLKLFFMLFECVYIVDLLTCCSVFWNWYPSRHAGEQGTLIGDYVTGKHLKEISVCLWKCFLPSFCCEPWVEMSFSSHIKLRWRKLFLQQLFSAVTLQLLMPSLVDSLLSWRMLDIWKSCSWKSSRHALGEVWSWGVKI